MLTTRPDRNVADRVSQAWRATALGIYRFIWDGGYALGAIVAGAGLVALAPTLMDYSFGDAGIRDRCLVGVLPVVCCYRA